MAKPLEKIYSGDLTSPVKNRLFITIPGYEKSHRCYANFYKNRHGKMVLRPAISREDRPEADLIHTTLWNEGSGLAVCNSSYIDCDSGRARPDVLLGGKINENKLRTRLDEIFGQASQYFKLVRSRSGKGIHVWFFFSGFPVLDGAKDTIELLKLIQTALIKLLEDFGADPNALGIERWGTNWRNPARMIDPDIIFHQAKVSRSKAPVIGELYKVLKNHPDTKPIFQKPLRRWYPDQRVSSKVTAFAADHLPVLDSGCSLILTRKELLSVLSISKNTLPELLSEPVGKSTTRLRGISIVKDLLRRGCYSIQADEDFPRLRHLAEAYAAERKAQKCPKQPGRAGQAIMIFEPTRRPESVTDGERNYCISQVYLKLKWHGCTLETAKRIVEAYVKRMPGRDNSSSVSRHSKKGENVYQRFNRNEGCKPGLAEDWLLLLASTKGSTKVSNPCPKSLKENYCAEPSRQKEKTPSPSPHSQGPQMGGSPSGGAKAEAPVVSLDAWRKKGSASTLVRNLAGALDLDSSSPKASYRSDAILSRRLHGKNLTPASTQPLSAQVSRLLRQDPRLSREQKAGVLAKASELIADGDLKGLVRLAETFGWTIMP